MGKPDGLSIPALDRRVDSSYELSRLPSSTSFESSTKVQDPLLKRDTQQYKSDDLGNTKPFPRGLTIRFSRISGQFHGWRAGALISSCIAALSLIINIAVVAWLGSRNDGLGVVEIFNGDCGKVQTMDIWVHLAINVISTLLLGGSNYCMQCLSAPTRLDIDRAHARGKWLDIGVPSARNLFAIPRYKALLWLILGLTSVPLHLMYNSAFYKSLSTNDYDIFVVDPGFLEGGSVNITNVVIAPSAIDPAIVQTDLAIPGRYERLNNTACINAYATDLNSDRRNLVLVSSNSTPAETTLLHVEHYSYANSVGPRGLYRPYGWICDDPDLGEKLGITLSSPGPDLCETYVPKIAAGLTGQWVFKKYPVDFCLSEVIPETCGYSGNVPIVSVVIICNAVKIGAMLFVALRLRDEPLITIGDAIESFLDHADEWTKGACLHSKKDVLQNRWEENRNPEPKRADFKHQKWHSAASGRRWTIVLGSLGFAIILVSILLAMAINAISSTAQSIWSIGLGKVNSAAIIRGWMLSSKGSETERILASILVANVPQTIFSFIYLQLNGLLTSMWLSKEWKGFEFKRKALRVSRPKGNQRSKHFLQLPYRAAIPMLAIAGLLHWILSQSIFLAVVAEYGNDGRLVNATTVGTCGFSPLATIFVIASAGCLVVGVIALGQRKFEGAMPLAGSCSAAISAACHRPDWDKDASQQPVQWGVFQDSYSHGGIGHCSITSADVQPVQQGEWYAGIRG